MKPPFRCLPDPATHHHCVRLFLNSTIRFVFPHHGKTSGRALMRNAGGNTRHPATAGSRGRKNGNGKNQPKAA